MLGQNSKDWHAFCKEQQASPKRPVKKHVSSPTSKKKVNQAGPSRLRMNLHNVFTITFTRFKVLTCVISLCVPLANTSYQQVCVASLVKLVRLCLGKSKFRAWLVAKDSRSWF